MAQLTNSINYGDLTVTGNINTIGNITANRVYNAVFNDYAECFDNRELNYSECKHRIVELDDEGFTVLANKNSRKVIGIVSDNYGVLLGGDMANIMNGNKIPVGLAGTLYVDTMTPVSNNDIGMFLTSTGGGYGSPKANPEPGTSVGKIIGIDKINNRYKVLLCLT